MANTTVFTTSFIISAAQTVPSNYSWDQGVPVLSAIQPTTFSNGVVYVSGYAPGIKVYISNTSSSDSVATLPDNPYDIRQLTTYNWNFNDYYNIGTNIISLSGNNITDAVKATSHTYIMPGKYSISLQHIQTTLPDNFTVPKTCYGDYDINWYWTNLEFNLNTDSQNIKAKTWDDYTSSTATPKTWDGNQILCLQKYCFNWNWNYLTFGSYNPVTWSQAKSTGKYAKLWGKEYNDTVCQQPIVPHDSAKTVRQDLLNSCIIEVVELPPVAKLFSLTSLLTGVSQLPVSLSPRGSVCGSFPIDRIDWNLGDGTPTKTVTRYSTTTDPAFTYTNVFSSDPSDVRNFDLNYTYYRNSVNTYSVFYPSLTCYSANTNTANSCCITVGPITLPSTPSSSYILKARNADTKDNMYVFDINNNVAFLTTASSATTAISLPVPNTPPTTIVSSLSTPTLYTGNNGNILIV